MVRITDSNVQDFEKKHIARGKRCGCGRCAVLPEEQWDLPLASAGKIALFGNGARNTIKGGTGSGDVNVRHFVSVEEGLENAGLRDYQQGLAGRLHFHAGGGEDKVSSGTEGGGEGCRRQRHLVLHGQGYAGAGYNIPLEGEAETAVYVLARNSGEGADRTPVAGDIN